MRKKFSIIILSAWIALSGLICTQYILGDNNQDTITLCDRDPIKVSQ